MSASSRIGLTENLKRRLLVLGCLFLLVWVLFFDSHSLLNRFLWYRETNRIEAQNQALREESKLISIEIEKAGEPQAVERVARESYGMRKDGETVYRVEDVND